VKSNNQLIISFVFEQHSFSGNRKDSRTFLNLLELNFRLSTAYDNDSVKIATLGMLLKDKAANWNQIYLENPQNYPELESWPAFRKHFELAFGDLDRKRSDADRLTRLVQTTSAADYAAEFQNLSSSLTDWGQEVLIYQFRRGLKEEVQRLLLSYRENFTSLLAIANAAIECDSVLFAIDRNNKRTQPQQPQQRVLNPVRQSWPRPPPINNPIPQQWRPPVNNPVPADPHAMEVDAMARRPLGPLNPEERAHRYNNQLSDSSKTRAANSACRTSSSGPNCRASTGDFNKPY
jgi:hypothetical protein